jgi:opacity protein-like surface antigen
MNSITRIALALSATGMTPLSALAADYDPPIYVDQAPEYTPVEVGSGWYLRGDVGYALNKPFEDDSFGSNPANYNETFDERFMPASASVGFGYHFNDYFRGEVNFGLMPFEETSQTSSFAGLPGISAWSASATTDNRM